MRIVNHISLFVLMPLAVLFPIISYSQTFSFVYFKEELLINISTIVFLVVFILFASKVKRLQLSKFDFVVISAILYSIGSLLFLNNYSFYIEVRFLLVQLLFYITLRTYFSQTGDNQKISAKQISLSLFIITLIPLIFGYLELTGIIPRLASDFRMTGGFFNQGQFANFLAIMFPFILLSVHTLNRNNRQKVLSYISIAAVAFLIIYSVARSAWIASAASSFYLLYKTNIHKNLRTNITISKQVQRVLKLGLFVILICGIVFIYLIKKDSANGRIFIWKNCIAIIQEKPIFGNGYGSFCKSYNDKQIDYFSTHNHNSTEGLLAYDAKFAFNDFLQTSVEKGLLGLFFLLIIYAFILSRTQEHKPTNTENFNLLLAIKASILALGICSLFSYPLESPTIILISILVFALFSAKYTSPVVTIHFRNTFNFFSPVVTLILIAILILETAHFQKIKKWKNASDLSNTIEVRKALDTYEDLSDEMKYNWNFQFNYGSSLGKIKEYERGIEVLEEARLHNNTYQLFYNLGHYYKLTKQYYQAEECFRNASNLIPHKLTPKYHLFELYQLTNNEESAAQLATIIDKIPMKVYTRHGARIKLEVSEYLQNITSQD
jgi:O-antigen polymerase